MTDSHSLSVAVSLLWLGVSTKTSLSPSSFLDFSDIEWWHSAPGPGDRGLGMYLRTQVAVSSSSVRPLAPPGHNQTVHSPVCTASIHLVVKIIYMKMLFVCVCVYLGVCVYTYVCMYLRVRVYVYVCLCVCVCISICVHSLCICSLKFSAEDISYLFKKSIQLTVTPPRTCFRRSDSLLSHLSPVSPSTVQCRYAQGLFRKLLCKENHMVGIFLAWIIMFHIMFSESQPHC